MKTPYHHPPQWNVVGPRTSYFFGGCFLASWCLSFGISALSVQAFVITTISSTKSTRATRNHCRSRSNSVTRPRTLRLLGSSSPYSDDENDDEKDDENDRNEKERLEELRSLLETSWNTDTMGAVPSSPSSAAQAAAEALQTALHDNNKSNNNNSRRLACCFWIDLHLPQYQAAAAATAAAENNNNSLRDNRWYDQVAAVDFCKFLAQRLRQSSSSQGTTAIVVRDQNMIDTVQRVWAARGEDIGEGGTNRGGSNSSRSPNKDLPFSRAADRTVEPPREPDDANDFYDDFADLGLNSDTSDMSLSSTNANASKNDNDIDSFRRKLALTWESSSSGDEPRDESSNKKDDAVAAPSNSFAANNQNAEQERHDDDDDETNMSTQQESYRLTSFFGKDADSFSSGPDMPDKVIRCVSQHLQIAETDDTIIVLSAISRPEVVAVRALAQTHGTSKTIILVNCCLVDPIPVELVTAQTVYSIRPMIARAKPKTSNRAATEQAPVSPKVVILKRYPGDWQIHVDVMEGNGFELAASIPASQVHKKQGPKLEWVGQCVQRYLEARRKRSAGSSQ